MVHLLVEMVFIDLIQDKIYNFIDIYQYIKK